MHQRTLIRKAVKALLFGETAAGRSVSTTRTVKLQEKDLPHVSVYTLEESVSDEADRSPPEIERELQLVIAGWVDPRSGVDDAMDALALEIETAMAADPTLGGLVADCSLVATSLGLQGEGDSLVGLVELEYAVTYQTLTPEPTADEDADDFLRVHSVANLGHAVHVDDRATDDFTVQEVSP